ncbi:hypothetical protein SASPL_108689 [Salvia splendens]|uniref:Uncharacterized protein n=1 Tax=Salvia splendens TaxID=180675 RepID=A0A8X9A6F2_SALSN|nr:hypothetical protein SASPL_108689 [Salvia splendens]
MNALSKLSSPPLLSSLGGSQNGSLISMRNLIVHHPEMWYIAAATAAWSVVVRFFLWHVTEQPAGRAAPFWWCTSCYCSLAGCRCGVEMLLVGLAPFCPAFSYFSEREQGRLVPYGCVPFSFGRTDFQDLYRTRVARAEANSPTLVFYT